MLDLSQHALGKSGEKHGCNSREEFQALALAMATQCHRTLDICGRHLDAPALDEDGFAAAVKTVALRSRFSRIRLFILQPDALYTRGHSLLRLAQQLPSFIHVRVPGAEHRDFNEAMIIADEVGYIHRALSDRYEGIFHFNDRKFANELLRRFEYLWESGELDPNFRRLHT